MEYAKKITTETVLINASRQEVWKLLFHRFGETYLYNPNLESSHTTISKNYHNLPVGHVFAIR